MKKTFLLPLALMFTLVGCGNQPSTPAGPTGPTGPTSVTITDETLLGYNRAEPTSVTYDKEVKEATVDTYLFAYQEMSAVAGSNYAGLQWRNKLSDTSRACKSNFYNKAAFGRTITSVAFTWHANKNIFDATENLVVTFDNVATFDSAAKEQIKYSTVAGTKEFTVTPAGKAFTFVKMEIADNYTYSMYWESIVINLAE